MKLLRVEGDEFEIEFAPEEKALLFHLLGLYPAVPAAYHRLTKDKTIPDQKENQQLLDDALQSQRKANQKEIIALVGKAGRFTDSAEASRAIFQRGELEWLLQVLNDVRVGSWIALGSPTTAQERQVRSGQGHTRQMMVMELAGSFEMFILRVVSGTLKPEAGES